MIVALVLLLVRGTRRGDASGLIELASIWPTDGSNH
jgi:hypothetical protein